MMVGGQYDSRRAGPDRSPDDCPGRALQPLQALAHTLACGICWASALWPTLGSQRYHKPCLSQVPCAHHLDEPECYLAYEVHRRGPGGFARAPLGEAQGGYGAGWGGRDLN